MTTDPAPDATRRRPRTRRTSVQALVLIAVVIGLTGCTNNTFTRLGFPDPVTKEGTTVVTLWQGSWIAGLAVGVLVWGLILWAVVFHRKRGDRLPPQVRYNMPIEIMCTTVPFVLIAILFYYTAKDENYIDHLPKNPAVTVNVTGFQWSWQFNYPKYNVTMTGNMANPDLPITPRNQQNLPVLEIPVNETVQFNLTSADVVHAFWVPEFLFKRDVIPDHPNHFTITTTKTGTFLGHCSELCGVYHSRMLFWLKIVPQQQFQQDMQQLQAQHSGSTQ
ncbi:MAG TPA: cytochrome c oxidase subunit II [Streptosporangiaceae bacterium]